MLPSAYMHDLSERGRDYAPEEIPGLFIMQEPPVAAPNGSAPLTT